MTMLKTPEYAGEILVPEVLEDLGIFAGKLATDIHVTRTRIEGRCDDRTSVTSDTAKHLSRALGTGPKFRLNIPARMICWWIARQT